MPPHSPPQRAPLHPQQMLSNMLCHSTSYTLTRLSPSTSQRSLCLAPTKIDSCYCLPIQGLITIHCTHFKTAPLDSQTSSTSKGREDRSRHLFSWLSLLRRCSTIQPSVSPWPPPCTLSLHQRKGEPFDALHYCLLTPNSQIQFHISAHARNDQTSHLLLSNRLALYSAITHRRSSRCLLIFYNIVYTTLSSQEAR